jgi:ribonuclease HII
LKAHGKRGHLKPPSLAEENTLTAQGFTRIAGVDEVGIGALAGPVVAAAIILPADINLKPLADVRDSKEVLPAKREILYGLIIKAAISFGIGVIEPAVIDSVNIFNATKLAMCHAIRNLVCVPDYLLVDGIIIPGINIRQKNIIRGDKLCFSIACASIVAKVTRDRIMNELDKSYPYYGLTIHKGYGTKRHLSCLDQYGPSPIHRFSFTPVKKTVRLL